MNTETKNRPVRKVAAVVGFIALLILIAWVSIMIVRNVPGSFASLASLAESVRSFDASQTEVASDDEATQTDSVKNMLIVTSDTNVIETDQNVRLSWTDTTTPGTFVFSYTCIDGVNVTIVENDGVRSINCGTNYNLGNINNTTLNIDSENERYVDVEYALSFLASNEVEPSTTDTATITVVNENIPLFSTEIAVNNTEGEVNSTETNTADDSETFVAVVPEQVTPEVEIEPEVAVDPEDTTTTQEENDEVANVTPTVEPETTPESPFTQEFTYTIPVSDPDGRIDLATRFINTGSIVNNTFIAGQISSDELGAIQFEVKNLGTKTSDEWTYSVSLPTGGTIDSTDQEPLKPNERALITIGFPATDLASFDFEVTIDADSDNTSINDRFVEQVAFNN